MKYILLFSILASTCFATMSPQEKKLVSGLSSQNDELRGIVTEQKAQIEKFASDAIFADQKIDYLTGRLAESKKLEGDQEFELGLQQKLIHDKAVELDAAYKGWNEAKDIADKKTAEAHRNAVERDICLFALSVAVTVLVMIYSGQIIGWITSKFPALTPYGIGLWIGLAILTFISTFGASRGVLAMIASRL